MGQQAPIYRVEIMVDEKQQNDSIIVIKFAEPGSVVFNAQFINVTPMQILALAEYMRIHGEQAVIREEIMRAQQQKEQQIIVPKMNVNLTNK